MTIDQLINQLAAEGGAIVTSGECSEMEIADAQATGRFVRMESASSAVMRNGSRSNSNGRICTASPMKPQTTLLPMTDETTAPSQSDAGTGSEIVNCGRCSHLLRHTLPGFGVCGCRARMRETGEIGPTVDLAATCAHSQLSLKFNPNIREIINRTVNPQHYGTP